VRGGEGEGEGASLESRAGSECPPLSQGEREREKERAGDELASDIYGSFAGRMFVQDYRPRHPASIDGLSLYIAQVVVPEICI
jgi:hypothetical protein